MAENETDTPPESVKIVAEPSGALFESWPDVTPESEPSGWVARINRVVGIGDYSEYTPETFAGINAFTGREDGVVSGNTWAYFMPELRKGSMSSDVALLKRYLGQEPSNWFDQELADAIGTEVLDAKTWQDMAGPNRRGNA